MEGSPQRHQPFEQQRSPRVSEGATGGAREGASPVELTQSRENSVHGPGPSGKGWSALTLLLPSRAGGVTR
jgi:hypothetical protein